MNPLQLSQALEALLDGDPRFLLEVGKVPTTPPDAYAVLYPDAGIVSPARLGGEIRALKWNPRCVCVGRTTDQCINTVAIVRGLATGVRLDPSRSASKLIEVDEGARIVKAENVDLSDIRYSFTIRWRLSRS